MAIRKNRSGFAFFLFYIALLILLLPVSVYAGEQDGDPGDADSPETVNIPGYTQNAYGYCYTGDEQVVRIPAALRASTKSCTSFSQRKSSISTSSSCRLMLCAQAR